VPRGSLAATASLGKRQPNLAERMLHGCARCGGPLVWAACRSSLPRVARVTRLVHGWHLGDAFAAHQQAVLEKRQCPKQMVLPTLLRHVPPGTGVLEPGRQAGQEVEALLP